MEDGKQRMDDYYDDEELEIEKDDLPSTSAPLPPPTKKDKKVAIANTLEYDTSRRRSTLTMSKVSLFDWIKISALAVVWAICAFLLMTSTTKVDDAHLIALYFKNKTFDRIPVAVTGRSLRVTLLGPFAPEEELVPNREPSERARFVVISVKRVFYNPKGVGKNISVTISDFWKIKLASSKELAERVKLQKSNIFHLREVQSPRPGYSKNLLVLRLRSNVRQYIAVKVWYDPFPLDERLGLVFGSFVLIFLYVLIVSEIINRTFAAVIASTLAIAILAALNARPSLDTIMSWIDTETLVLLFGMMILVAILSDSGIFDFLAVFAYEITKGRIWPLINTLSVFVGVLSAFLDNVTMMLLVTPVVIRLCEVTSLNPVPILIIVVLYSNIGAALTPVGDPPNVIICSNHFIAESNVNFLNFFCHMVPGVIFAAVVVYILVRFMFRDFSKLQFKESQEVQELRREIGAWQRTAEGISVYSKDEALVRETLLKKVERLKMKLHEALQRQRAPNIAIFEQTLQNMKEDYPIRNKTLLVKAVIAFVFVVGLFFLHSIPNFHHLTMGWTALLGALLLLIIADVEDMEAILVRIEWSTLLFFACLFIVMEALAEMGVIDVIGNMVVNLIMLFGPEWRLASSLLIVLWSTAIASAFLDNIPVTTMMVKIVITLAENKELDLPLHPLVWALAYGACFGGNGTLIGASANVVSAGVIEQHGYKCNFVQFFVVGFPVMLATILTTTIYLLIAHVLFQWH